MTHPSSPGPRATVLVAAHGSSHPAARGALSGFVEQVRAACSGHGVHLAYTASPDRGNHRAPAPEPACPAPGGLPLGALLESLDTRHTRLLVVQSLHVIAGDEFNRAKNRLEAFASARNLELRLGGPLLRGPDDLEPVALALAESLPADLAPDEAVVFMGHGTTHAAQELYQALAERLAERGLPVLLGVLEATAPEDPLSLASLTRELARTCRRRVRLMPLLTVSGRHAAADLAGDGPDAWRTRLEASGLLCRADLAGLVERPSLRALWLGRLAGLLAP